MSSIRRPWYPWYPKDFIVDEKVQGLSPIAELLYRRALDVMWQANDCQLPNQMLKLCYQLGKGLLKQEFENAWSEIQHPGFELFKITEDEQWIYSKRLKIEAEKIEKLCKIRRKSASKGGQASAKAKAQAKGAANVKQTSSHTEPDPDINRGTKVPLVETDIPTNGNCPYQNIMDLYHTILPTLPTVRVLSDPRRAQIKARWNSRYKTKTGIESNTLEFWDILFHYIDESDFLMGRTDPPPGRKRFVADLEWITKQANFIKIFEGKYHN